MRNTLAAALAAGITLTIAPAAAAATDPADWQVTDQSRATLDRDQAGNGWSVTDLTGSPRSQAARGAGNGASRGSADIGRDSRGSQARTARRVPRVAGQTRSTWRASTTCRPTATLRDGERLWRVGPGDTLSGIAACHPGVTWRQVQRRNGLPDTLIMVGQRLVIPRAGAR